MYLVRMNTDDERRHSMNTGWHNANYRLRHAMRSMELARALARTEHGDDSQQLALIDEALRYLIAWRRRYDAVMSIVYTD